MLKLLWSCIIALLFLAGCGMNGSPTRQNDFVPLTSIEVVAVPQKIAANTSIKLSVIGNFSGAFTRDVTSEATWTTDAPAVAAFVTGASPNRVTGLAPGSALLTATVGSVKGTFDLTVTSATVTAVAVTPANPTISTGQNAQFAASGTFSDGTTQDVTFDAAWASSMPGIATVGDDVASKGYARALTVGTTTISATFAGVSGTALLTVTEPVLQSISVAPGNPSVLSLSTAALTATAHYSNGTTANITNQVTWTSNSPDIATIDTSGKATTLRQGAATITATFNGVSGTTNLRVTGGNLTGITISPASLTLVKTTMGRITATGTFSNGSSRDITGAVTWTTSNNAIASVTAPGGNLAWLNANAVTQSTTFTATSGNISRDANLRVTSPTLSSVTISPATLTSIVGVSDRFVLTAFFGDNTSQDVTYSSSWTSSDPSIATVGNTDLAKGKATGLAAGTVAVSATYGTTTATAQPVRYQSRNLRSLTISGAPLTLGVGNQAQFKVTAEYIDGSKDVTEDATWATGNANIAAFADPQNKPGQVVAVDTGTTSLTATFGGITQTATLTVR